MKIVLVVAVAALCCASSLKADYIDYIDQHLPLSDYHHEDVIPKFEAAKKLLEEKLKQNYRSDLVEPLQAFVKLEQVYTGRVICSQDSLDILRENYKILGPLSKLQIERENVFGMRKALWDVMKRHSNTCNKHYSQEFNNIVNQLDPLIKLKVSKLTDPMIHRRVNDWKYEFGDRQDAQLVYDQLVLLAKAQNDWDRKYLAKYWTNGVEEFNSQKFEELVDKYLYQPCFAYLHSLRVLMELDDFDSKVNPSGLAYRQREQFDVCSAMVGKKIFFNEYLKAIGVTH